MDILDYCDEDSFILNSDYENILNSFKTHQISTSELLLSSISTIARKLNKTEEEISKFLNKFENERNKKLLNSIHKPFKKDNDNKIIEETNYFTIGDESIDKILNGGIPIGYLIEISGKSASGKTNLLLTLSITIQLPKEFGGLGPSIFSENTNDNNNNNNNIKTLYIPTESPLATIRLNQIIDNFSELLKMNGISDNEKFYPKLDNVLTTSNPMSNLEEQDHILKYQVPVMLTRDPSIKLLIIDSLTHHVRAQLTWFEQISYVKFICTYLKKLAKKFNITIIIANQVTDKPVKGLYCSNNNLIWKLNTEYQLAWMNGWDNIGIIYRQLMRNEGKIDEAGKSFDRLDYLDDLQNLNYNEEIKEFDNSSNSNNLKLDLKNILKMERKRLFDNNYKVKISEINTRPALGLSLLEFIDMRIVLKREYAPIFDEELIDEFSVELGINLTNSNEEQNLNDNSFTPLETSTQDTTTTTNSNKNIKDKTQIVKELSNNTYLKNYNFESFKSLKCVFGPLIPAGESKSIDFEIWKGGIRKYNR